ncbi:hypothetical protein EV188_103741 [Actinomycetospora succinea]|uniref:Uncharacterized protein n=1 Tax=Actinomycetospora succinea TaxID=663603 RepID=A0A4R6VIM9_9PSEU|nr:hypothetical protein [Actinomycetospora succinea]TDQ61234.1 hypothetical protein EV188_103741 [Actinomycetospora succinea]
MTEGFGVDPAMLARTAQGIRGVVDTLGEVGHGYLAESGRGLSFLALGGEESGHPLVGESFDGFLERWGWGLRTLVQDGQAVAGALDAAGIEYDGVDTSVSGELRRLVALAAGNPATDLDEAQDATWGEVGADLAPDFSGESAQAAAEGSADQWGEVGRDLWEQSAPGRIGRALDGENPFAGDLADLEGLGEIVE